MGGEYNIENVQKYTVPKMESYDKDYTLQNSIHHIFKTHAIVPELINEFDLFNDLDIKLKKDYEFDDKNIKKFLVIYKFNKFKKTVFFILLKYFL